jgi:peroxiredoxin
MKARRNAPLSPRLLVVISLCAGCVALAVAYFAVVRPNEQKAAEAIDVGDFLNGSPNEPSADNPLKVGDHAPTLRLTGLNGPDVALADLNGKVVVINFWAASCTPCRKEMPLFEAASKKSSDSVAFVGVDVSESVATGTKMIKETGVTFPQTRDPDGQLIRAFGGIQLPHTVVLSADGKVSAVHNRTITSAAELDDLIKAAK